MLRLLKPTALLALAALLTLPSASCKRTEEPPPALGKAVFWTSGTDPLDIYVDGNHVGRIVGSRESPPACDAAGFVTFQAAAGSYAWRAVDQIEREWTGTVVVVADACQDVKVPN